MYTTASRQLAVQPTSDRLPVRAVGLSALTIGGAVVVLLLAANSGGTLAAPVGHKIWEIAVTVTALLLLTIGCVQSFRARRFTRVLLMTIAPATAFWQETYGDWGAYLRYSDKFVAYDWGHTRWTSPVQCWWFIAGYVVFYTTLFASMGSIVEKVKSRWPQRNPYLLTTLASFPVFYLFDLVLEGAATGFGWWHYTYIFGPGMPIGHGSFPLLWPIVEQIPFIAVAAWAMTWRNSDGEDVFDILARSVLRRTPGQLSIALSWIIVVNISFFVTTIFQLMAMRWIAGPPSVVVP